MFRGLAFAQVTPFTALMGLVTTGLGISIPYGFSSHNVDLFMFSVHAFLGAGITLAYSVDRAKEERSATVDPKGLYSHSLASKDERN